ncbi:MAG: hypothetical protein U0704_07250 [Candidatus Eisenbacteria bacterium]
MPKPLRHLLLAFLLAAAACATPFARAAAADPEPWLTVSTFTETVETPYFRVAFDLTRPDAITSLFFKPRDPYRDLAAEEYYGHEFFGQDLRGRDSVGSVYPEQYTEVLWQLESLSSQVAQIMTRSAAENRPPVVTRYWFFADQPWFVVERTIQYSQVPYTGSYQDFLARIAFYDTYRALRYRDTNGALQQRGWCALPCVTQGWDGRWLQTVGYRLGQGQSVTTIYPASVRPGQPFVRGSGPNTYSGWAAPLWDSLAYTTDVTRRTLVAFSTQPDSIRQLDSLWTYFNSPGFTLDAPAPVRAPELRLAVSPNPSYGTVTLAWALPRAQYARLEVLDLSGRRVATLHDGEAPAGELRAAWNGRTDSGGGSHPAAPGVYWARLVTPDGVRTRTIVRVR